ncbi:MAG: hypothetical protein AAFN30_05080 [Actinomycetota bacterium]
MVQVWPHRAGRLELVRSLAVDQQGYNGGMNTPCKVSILGWGAIGRTVGLALADGQVSGA